MGRDSSTLTNYWKQIDQGGSFILEKNLINKKINVHIYHKKKITNFSKNRTIGISKNNFELARLSLTNQARERGFVESISRKNWDTFAGWKKRGGSIKSGSKGLKVDIVVPHTDMHSLVLVGGLL